MGVAGPWNYCATCPGPIRSRTRYRTGKKCRCCEKRENYAANPDKARAYSIAYNERVRSVLGREKQPRYGGRPRIYP